MIPPIPPTPPQIGAPPPLGAPLPMAPMPPSPMGKGLGSMLNTDPMARSNFSMMLSDIQNQAMIPPMPMHMNEGGLVGFIQNLLKGIGSIFRGGGGQQGGSGSLKDFERAFAVARAAGQPTFTFDRDGDGVDEIYTTRYEDEPIEGEEQKKDEVTQAVKKSTTPSDSELFDMLIKRGAQQSQTGDSLNTDSITEGIDKLKGIRNDLFRIAEARGEPVFTSTKARFTGFDPKDPEGGRPRTESEDIARNFANRLEQIKRQMEADQSEAPDVDFSNRATIDTRNIYELLGGRNLNTTIDANLEGGNAVDVIQDQLEKLINVSGDQPNLPEGLTEGVKPMGLGEKIESLYQSGLRNIGNVKEEASNLASRIKELNESLNNRENIVGKIRGLIGMTEGGNPKVEQELDMVKKLKAMIAESSNPQEKLQELFEYFTGDSTKDEDNSQILEAIAIIQQSPEFMNEATRSSLLGTMPPQPKERVSDNVMGRKFGLQKDFYDELKNLIIKNPFMDAQIRLNIKKPPEGMSPIESAMGVTGAPRYVFTPEVKELLGLSNGGSVTDAIAKLENGGRVAPTMGGGGDMINRLLSPLVNQIGMNYSQQNNEELQNRLDDFRQQVGDLTQTTFPDVSFENQNQGFYFGSPQFRPQRQFQPFNPARNELRAIARPAVYTPPTNQTSPFPSSIKQNFSAIKSFFENRPQMYNEGGAVPIQGFANGGESYGKSFFTNKELENQREKYSNPQNIEEARAYRSAGGTDTGFGNILSLQDLKTTFTGGDPGNQYLRQAYNEMPSISPEVWRR